MMLASYLRLTRELCRMTENEREKGEVTVRFGVHSVIDAG